MIAADAMHAVKRQRAQQQQQQLVACGLWVEVFWGDVLGFGRGGNVRCLRFHEHPRICLLSSSLRYPRLPSSCVPIF
jgi:hypothetical protein